MSTRRRRRPVLVAAALVGLLLGGMLGYHVVRLRAAAREMKLDSARDEAAEKMDPALAAADNAFGLRLLAELRKAQPGENVFISPASVAMCLHMVYHGAAGDTKAAMAKTLELGEQTTDQLSEADALLREALRLEGRDLQLRTANSLWLQQNVTLLPAFIQANQTHYGAHLATLNLRDPKAVGTINGWVSDQTHGRIPELLDRIDPGVFLILVNAAYFHGKWAHRFDQRETTGAAFYLPDGPAKPVPMMRYDGECLYSETELYQAVCLPYVGEELSMYVLLPREEVGLDGLCSRLDADRWDEWTSRFGARDGTVHLPQIRLEWVGDLNDALKAMGMGIAFDQNRADFSGMATGFPIWVHRARHGTALDVDEKGTEAGAATSVEMMQGKAREQPLLTVDRPFLCAIADSRTHAILFLGAIADPQPGAPTKGH